MIKAIQTHATATRTGGKMYYTVNDENGMIIEASDVCPDPQEQADYFNCPVYIIDGEHSGLTASPTKAEKPRAADFHGQRCKSELFVV